MSQISNMRGFDSPTTDVGHGVLSVDRCATGWTAKMPRRRGQCDLCGLLSGVRAIETTRHLALACPYPT